mmetsp:Transcript_24432/g.59279  ORF Transcript_24432/g.59279 Transcript_24432/m.59279 type:complete len:319 (-) Transcript_24432:867-1823(-)
MLDVLLDGHEDGQNPICLALRTSIRSLEGGGRGRGRLATRCLLMLRLDQRGRLSECLHSRLQNTVGLLHQRLCCLIIKFRCGELSSLSFALRGGVLLCLLRFGDLSFSILDLLLKSRVLSLQLFDPCVILIDGLRSLLRSDCISLALLITIKLVLQVVILLLPEVRNHVVNLFNHLGKTVALSHESRQRIQSKAAGVRHAERASSQGELLPRSRYRGRLHKTLRLKRLLEGVPSVVRTQDRDRFVHSCNFLLASRSPGVELGGLRCTRSLRLRDELFIIRASCPQIRSLIFRILFGFCSRRSFLGGSVLCTDSGVQFV